jgi:A/G-specific adenine glycosylase
VSVKQKPSDTSYPDQPRRAFRKNLLAWYDLHRRDLPWRENRDPYRVWLSEIMLQQTRVAAVIAHYHEFLRRFPSVEKLASAREASVLAAWSGLGYYRRARMLHAAAKVIVRKHGGKFPPGAEALQDLPGVGRYTAAAIASIAFNHPVAVVDGNVERVLARVKGQPLGGESVWVAANELLDVTCPGDFNQAMMELGAVVCTPRAPHCLVCPVMKQCATRGELPRTTKVSPQRKREIHYALHCRDGRVLLVQRARGESLMAGMWELPEMGPGRMDEAQQKDEQPISHLAHGPVRNGGNQSDTIKNSSVKSAGGAAFILRHSITDTDYTVRVWRGGVSLPPMKGKFISVEQLPGIALTGLARKILRKAQII